MSSRTVPGTLLVTPTTDGRVSVRPAPPASVGRVTTVVTVLDDGVLRLPVRMGTPGPVEVVLPPRIVETSA